MSQPIIEIKGIGKKYNIAHQRGKYVALRDVLANVARRPFAFLKHKAKAAIGLATKEEFWALRDINLDINKGDIVGIIGSNGAGKSTLLKILTGITPPTEGEIIMRGRVASLLEVGTGFHPELTGRENIFLNGAILGMMRKEIAQKFDEIVAFAGVEKFLDTPVKHYSSGMYVRLAFSVAAHMEPDILLVDEVLAVGDAEFQKKCLGKMEEVTTKEGRTILFVSHNMGMIERLCTACVLLEKGHVRKMGRDVRGIIGEYLNMQTRAGGSWVNPDTDFDNEYFLPLSLSAVNKQTGEIQKSFRADAEITLRVEVNVQKADPLLNMAYALYDERQTLLYWSSMEDQKKEKWPELKQWRNIFETHIPPHLLNEGMYRIELLGWLHMHKWLIQPGNAPSINIIVQGGLSDSPHWTEKRPGILGPLIPWEKVS